MSQTLVSPAPRPTPPEPQPPRTGRSAVRPWFVVVVALAAGVAGNVSHDLLFHGEPAEPAAAGGPQEPAGPSADAPAPEVRLSEGKLEAAGIRSEPVEPVALAHLVDVSGRVGPNVDRRVEIRPRAPGVIRTVHVVLGQEVKAGDPLLTLDSAEVGTARLNLRARRRELATARVEEEWRQTVAANVEALVPLLRQNTPAKDLEDRFADRPLGDERARLLASYADLEIALHEEDVQVDLHKRQIVGEHPMNVAIHTREGAQAKFQAMLEQVRFDAGRQSRLAAQGVRDAEAAVIDAAQRLRILGVEEDLAHALETTPGGVSAEEDDVTGYRILAPFDGHIVGRQAVPSQHAEPADTLLTLANLATVWVSADVPESALASLPGMSAGGTVRLSAAAYPGRTFEARVLSVGAEVDARTRTVPLLAEADNAEGLLKLGMFARVVLADGADEPALAVPSAAIVELDGRPVVFVPESDERTFQPRAVTPGREADGRRAILAGLSEGERVVVAGAFLLKSELILQNEPDEE